MTCPKCRGLMATYYGETRCLQCGYREGDLNRVVGAEIGRDALREPRCHWCTNPPAPNRSMCRYHLEAARTRRQKRRTT